ncbi:hypothetical protein F2P81_017963 [Scophthalmus maximus]|uniref:Uncharacterized protein n=1 Tax=Scophthalmus maximus TaxID=52904 RepID=A0A6A4S9D1_SCOMX|nr:hypothetical protein F2P81_017963 [Scophthalmus maximus]
MASALRRRRSPRTVPHRPSSSRIVPRRPSSSLIVPHRPSSSRSVPLRPASSLTHSSALGVSSETFFIHTLPQEKSFMNRDAASSIHGSSGSSESRHGLVSDINEYICPAS